MLVEGKKPERRLMFDELIFNDIYVYMHVYVYSIVCNLYLPLIYIVIKYNSAYFSLIHIPNDSECPEMLSSLNMIYVLIWSQM